MRLLTKSVHRLKLFNAGGSLAFCTEGCPKLRLPRRGAQGGVGLPATGSSSRRSGDGPKTAEIAFLGGWYKFETPQPLRRPTQTGLGRSARTPTDCGTCGFGEGVVGSDHRHGSWPLRAHTLKTPWPLKRPTQTDLGHPAHRPTDCGTCGFGEGVVSSDRQSGGQPLRTPSAAPALGWAP
eukprot:scaffold17227_cov60-Phaeocystis_antarctica.AAC.5